MKTPPSDGKVAGRSVCSPRTRGWSSRFSHAAPFREMLPAHAGMVRPPQTRRRLPADAPRARGDGPRGLAVLDVVAECSPRMRGAPHFSGEVHELMWPFVVQEPRSLRRRSDQRVVVDRSDVSNWRISAPTRPPPGGAAG